MTYESSKSQTIFGSRDSGILQLSDCLSVKICPTLNDGYGEDGREEEESRNVQSLHREVTSTLQDRSE